MNISDGFMEINKKHELTYLEPDAESELHVTISDHDCRLDMSERIKQYDDFTFELETLTREMMLSAGRFTASVLHNLSESEKHLSNIEEYTKELRQMLDLEVAMEKVNV